MKIAKMYIEAAKRHNYVCSRLFELLQNINELDKKRILHNIYYLTGYIIECSCCAAIYTFYPKLQHKKNLEKDLIANNRKTKNVAFNDKSNNIFSIVGEGDHSLQHFANFHAFFDRPQIPLLNGDLQYFENHKCFDLFEKYNAEIRYELPETIILYDKNVKSFYEIALDIYNKVKKTYRI